MSGLDNDEYFETLRRVGLRLLGEVPQMLDRVATQVENVAYDAHAARPLADLDWPVLVRSLLVEHRSVDDVADRTAAGLAARVKLDIPLDSFLRAIEVAAAELWASVARTAAELEVDAGFLIDFAPTVFELSRVFMARVTELYRSRDEEHARADEQRRLLFVQDVLIGTRPWPALQAIAVELGLDPESAYLAVRGRALTDPANLLSRIGTAARRDSGVALLSVVEQDVVGLMSVTPHDDVPGTVIGVGPMVALADLPTSFSMATRALDTAFAFERTGTFRVDDLGLLPAVVSEADIGDRLVERYLAPLRKHGAFGSAIIHTIAQHIDCSMNLEATARTLGVHRNTLKHRLRRYQEITGADLHSSQVVFEIWWSIQRSALRA